MFNINLRTSPLVLGLLLLASATALGQGTAFSYQGRLADGGTPATGNYDFEFKLYDTADLGTGILQGAPLQRLNVGVANGVFTVTLDFGVCLSCFNGADRFLEISVKPNSGGMFTTLGPRQPITATPYALKSVNATAADGLSVTCVNCVTSSQIQNVQGSQVTGNIDGSQINGAIPVVSIPPGSGSYIQNDTSPQAMSDFNISGNGTAGGTLSAATVDATTHYSIEGLRAFTVNGPLSLVGFSFTSSNTFAGDGAGLNTTPDPALGDTSGKLNSFFGAGAGKANTIGSNNSFFGSDAGSSNTTAIGNSFFGLSAGASNTTGGSNSFFGRSAGTRNTTGGTNSFFGSLAGEEHITGGSNSYFGFNSGNRDEAGGDNLIIGANAGFASSNTTGSGNVLVGTNLIATANLSNTTVAGYRARVTQSNATALGYRAQVDQTNSLVLGSINGVNGADADTKVGIGTTTPIARLHVASGSAGATPNANASLILESNAGHFLNILGPDASQIGILFGKPTGGGSVAGILFNSSPVFDGLQFRTGGNMTHMAITSAGDVGIGTTSPVDRLQVAGDIRVGTGIAGCVKDANGSVIAGACSSDARLKRDITAFPNLLDKLTQLQPVNFYWRADQFPGKHLGSSQSFGLVAQDVEKVMPELVSEDESGYKVVRYNKLPLLTIQAVKELKAENNDLRRQINQQQAVIDSITKFICLDHPTADLCR